MPTGFAAVGKRALTRDPLSPPELHKQEISYYIEVVNLCNGCSNVQGGRGGDNCNEYGVCTDDFMGAIQVGSARLKPFLNDTKVQVPTGSAAVGKRARTRPSVAPRALQTGNILFHRSGEFV